MRTKLITITAGLLAFVFMLCARDVALWRIRAEHSYQQFVVVAPGAPATKVWVKPVAQTPFQLREGR